MIDFLHIIPFKQASQQTCIVLTCEPGVETKVETRGDAIGVMLIVEIQGLSRKSAHQPMEEVVIGFNALVTVAFEFRDETIGIPGPANLVQVEDVEERIGHLGISLARHTFSRIRTTDVDPTFNLRPFCQSQNRIEVGNEAIFIHIYGDVSSLVLQHFEEISICRLVGETNAGISRLLIQSTAEQVEFLVETTAIELDARGIIHRRCESLAECVARMYDSR